mmetsp:Transcript_20292/g.57616  ORF Transcript_20292/g.57616 Transcript_20292/m.57616 type:complete len:221 (-) Transcript_20292:520-1182(-)
MIHHHPNGLHHGVARSRTNKLESALLQFFAHGDALRRFRVGIPQLAAPTVHDRFIVHEAPYQAVQWVRILRMSHPHLLYLSRIVDHSLDLSAMAHDHLRRVGRVLVQDAVNIVLRHRCDLVHIELMERAAVCFALAEDRQPRQSRLCPLQRNLFKHRNVTSLFKSPLRRHVAVVLFIAFREHCVPRFAAVVGIAVILLRAVRFRLLFRIPCLLFRFRWWK